MAYLSILRALSAPLPLPGCDNVRAMNYLMIRLGATIAGGGIIWAVYRATSGLNLNNQPLQSAAGAVLAQRGVIELTATGILMWLVGKRRRHTTAHL